MAWIISKVIVPLAAVTTLLCTGSAFASEVVDTTAHFDAATPQAGTAANNTNRIVPVIAVRGRETNLLRTPGLIAVLGIEEIGKRRTSGAK